ncbi:ABC transporter substrate-binding protein [Candidatus Margulisiibacteriota bacterium]
MPKIKFLSANSLLFFITTISLSLVLYSCGKKSDQNSKYKKIIATHSLGLCNIPLFITAEKQTAKEFNVELELKYIANWADHPAALRSGAVDVSVTPFTNVITAYANGMPIKIISGSGLNGLYLLGQKGINTPEKLKGKKIGTFRADTLEVTAYDALKKVGLSKKDFKMIYFTDGFELITAFANGSIDAMTHVEPYATQAIKKYQAEVIIQGQDIWGGSHPDCVLVTSQKALDTKRESLKAIIAGMLKAEAFVEQHYHEAIDCCVGKYYKANKEDIVLAGRSQPPGIDIRDKDQFIINRSKSLKELGYIDKNINKDIFDFTLLNEVIQEHPELWKAVKIKSFTK